MLKKSRQTCIGNRCSSKDVLDKSNIEKYVPAKEASNTWRKITNEGREGVFAFALEDVYPHGIKSEELNNIQNFFNEYDKEIVTVDVEASVPPVKFKAPLLSTVLLI